MESRIVHVEVYYVSFPNSVFPKPQTRILSVAMRYRHLPPFKLLCNQLYHPFERCILVNRVTVECIQQNACKHPMILREMLLGILVRTTRGKSDKR